MQADPIRILLIAPSQKILGGQSVQATRLLAALRQEPSIRVDFQPIDPDWPRLLRPLQPIRYVRTLIALLVYCSYLALRIPRYQIVHVFSAGYSSYTLWTLPALFFSKLWRKRIILNYRDGQAEDHLRNWRSALPTIRRMDVIVSPTAYLVDLFKKFDLEVLWISNILDMQPFIYRKRSRLRPIFLHNRILEPLYNIPCSLRAFQIVQQRYPEATLTVAHSGPSRGELEQLAAELGLRNTTFIGRVPHLQIGKLYDSADIYFTSPDFDCMPGSILECFASGLPVVASNVGGIPYIATDQKTALLFPRGDHEAMAKCALRLLEDAALVERLTAQAYAECTRYAADPVRKNWTALYHKLCNRP
jgi:glycosyltransferase involved in cell wall biosynthesis